MKDNIQYENLSDEELVKMALQHNRRAQEALYRRFNKAMYKVAMVYADTEADACDILQEGFIKFFKSLKRFKFDCLLKNWIRRIMVNTAITHYNKKKKEKDVIVPILNHDYESNENILTNLGLSSKEVVGLINELPSKAAMVLKLYAIEGYGHKEIADSLGITEGTSKSQLHRARTLLKQSIQQLYG
jgi:RNA polymerase sigma factor (sigma-70 family)